MGSSSLTYYKYKDKDTGKTVHTSSKKVADARSSGSYTDGNNKTHSPSQSSSSNKSSDKSNKNNNYDAAIRAAKNFAQATSSPDYKNFDTSNDYAYLDNYGYSHVSSNPAIARSWSNTGDVYNYTGPNQHGYALDQEGRRLAIPLPGAKNYSNYEPDTETPLMGRSEFDSLYPGALGGKYTPTATLGISTGPNMPSLIPTQQTMPIPQAGGGYFDRNFGGMDSYATNQQNRYQAAQASGDTDLINRLQADASRVGYSLIPQAPAGQDMLPMATQQQQMPLYPVPEPPEYKPYEFEEFKYKQPKYSITSDPDDTNFIPTSNAKNRWLQEQQQMAGQHQDAYQADQRNWENQQNIQWQQYQEQQRQQEQQQGVAREDAALAQQQKIQVYEQAMQRWQLTGRVMGEQDAAILGVPVGTLTSDQSYRNAAMALDQAKLSMSQASGGDDGFTPWQQYQMQGDSEEQQQQQALADTLSLSESYKTGADYLQDVLRYKGQLISVLGVDSYNALYEEAVKMDEQVRTGAKFKPGSSSPIKGWLEAITVNPNSPTSGPNSPNLWINEAMKITGVGSDWAQPLAGLMQKESSGNPKAKNTIWVNYNTGATSNSKTRPGPNWYQATGLMQMMEPTFNAYKVDGMGDIYNPVHNLVASINYINSKYGHPNNLPSGGY